MAVIFLTFFHIMNLKVLQQLASEGWQKYCGGEEFDIPLQLSLTAK